MYWWTDSLVNNDWGFVIGLWSWNVNGSSFSRGYIFLWGWSVLGFRGLVTWLRFGFGVTLDDRGLI